MDTKSSKITKYPKETQDRIFLEWIEDARKYHEAKRPKKTVWQRIFG